MFLVPSTHRLPLLSTLTPPYDNTNSHSRARGGCSDGRGGVSRRQGLRASPQRSATGQTTLCAESQTTGGGATGAPRRGTPIISTPADIYPTIIYPSNTYPHYYLPYSYLPL